MEGDSHDSRPTICNMRGNGAQYSVQCNSVGVSRHENTPVVCAVCVWKNNTTAMAKSSICNCTFCDIGEFSSGQPDTDCNQSFPRSISHGAERVRLLSSHTVTQWMDLVFVLFSPEHTSKRNLRGFHTCNAAYPQCLSFLLTAASCVDHINPITVSSLCVLHSQR